MFEDLADRMKHDEHVSSTEKVVRFAVIAVLSVVLFGGLYFVVRLLE